MATLPDLKFNIAAVDRSGAAFRGVLANLNGTTKGLRAVQAQATLLMGVFRGLPAALGVTALVRGLRDVSRSAGDLVDTAAKIGITTDALQELRFAGRQAGVGVGELEDALARFSKQLGAASQGQGDLYDILRANGVALADQAGQLRPVATLFAEYADLVARATSAQERNVLVTTAFGRSADEMGNLFQGGSAGVQAAMQSLDDYGGAVDDVDLQRLAALDDQWEALSQTMENWAKRVAVGVIDMLGSILGLAGDVAHEIVGINELNPNDDRYLGPEPLENATRRLRMRLGAPITGSAAEGGLSRSGFRDRFFGATGAALLPSRADSEAEREAERQQKRIADVIESLKAERDMIGLTGESLAGYNALQRAGIELGHERADEIVGVATALYREQEQYRRVTDGLQELRSVGMDVFDRIYEGISKGSSALEILGDIAGDVGRRLANMVIGNLFDRIFGMNAGGGVLGGGLLGRLTAGGGLFGGGLFGGMRAAGGPVDAGRLYLVGERGPELFAPGASGAIIPSAAGGGARVTVAPVYNIDARGSAMTEAQLRAVLEANNRALMTDVLPNAIARARRNKRV